MRLKHIEVFHAVMLTGSVSAASRLLHVTQPAVTQALQHAELQLGYALFTRQRRRLIPTREAQALYPEVQALMSQLESVRRMGAVAGLSAQLEALQRRGLFVHWAAVEAGITEGGQRVRMPLAVVTISRSDLPTAEVRLPAELEVTPEGGPTTH